MKKIFIFTATLLISNVLLSNPSHDYMDYLPEESKIRQECQKCKGGFPFWRSKKQKKCDYIRRLFERLDTEDPKPASRGIPGYWGGVLEILTIGSNQANMKDAIRAILEDETDETKWEEYHLVSATAEKIKKLRKKRLEHEKKEAKEQKKREENRF